MLIRSNKNMNTHAIISEQLSLLFTHKLDTCCQAMCQNVKQSRIQPFAVGEL